MNKCFSEYGTEKDIQACVAENEGKGENFDPDADGAYRSLTNTHSMYHQPAQTWVVVGA
eukprot:CAMPEP_0114134806 /NCGR_PEP_ID=MMETSP0043_2-20121206/14369_1 /TAXON_ID=464988 /ORGANISM="Hemiselmis andersenii, Strain CCMP644" /LENGTH=58 /DNA_ID=CAMNT_0001228501 /DNA_START=65 /DNA_END=241 /DNA_ORIENTATION=+